MPRLDGVGASREIVSRPPRPRALVLTIFDRYEAIDEALETGADAFLLQRATPEQLIDGIRTVYSCDALAAVNVPGPEQARQRYERGDRGGAGGSSRTDAVHLACTHPHGS